MMGAESDLRDELTVALARRKLGEALSPAVKARKARSTLLANPCRLSANHCTIDTYSHKTNRTRQPPQHPSTRLSFSTFICEKTFSAPPSRYRFSPKATQKTLYVHFNWKKRLLIIRKGPREFWNLKAKFHYRKKAPEHNA